MAGTYWDTADERPRGRSSCLASLKLMMIELLKSKSVRLQFLFQETERFTTSGKRFFSFSSPVSLEVPPASGAGVRGCLIYYKRRVYNVIAYTAAARRHSQAAASASGGGEQHM
jgi:hypothetical protein